MPLPVGFLYDAQGQVVLDPDQQVQQSIRFLFQSFRRLGSAVRRRESLPRGEVAVSPPAERWTAGWRVALARNWASPQCCSCCITRATQAPSCTGALACARRWTGSTREHLPQEEWHTLLLGAHPGYITWEEYQENQRRLQENAHALGPERRKSPPREGPALLQGLVLCGICGERMKVVYHVRAGPSRA